MANGLADLQLFTLQLSVMLNAGVSLPQALATLAPMGGPLEPVVRQILRKIEGGHPLSQALERFPSVFPTTYRRVIRVGESTGQLLLVLPSLSQNLSQQMLRGFPTHLTHPNYRKASLFDKLSTRKQLDLRLHCIGHS